MFSNLIESGSHRADLRRKGKFFLGATAFYALLLAATGVGSIYAYNARIDDASELEVLAVMRFSPAETRPEPERREESRPAASDSREQSYATRVNVSVVTPYHSDRVAPEGSKDINARTPVRVDTYDSDPKTIGGPANTKYAGGPGGDGHDTGPTVDDNGTTTPPPPPRVTPPPAPPAERKGPVHLTSTVLTGKAINKPAPPYPQLAKAAGVQGSVAVQVLIDEQGRVLNAKATNGHPLLQQAAVQAAYKASFSPTVLTGTPVKVTGVITYNFVLNK
jgi:periplasmic protein TonB